MKSRVLLALLLPLCSAAPLEKKGQNVDIEADHDRLHDHGEEKIGLFSHEGDNSGHDHREQKMFSHNKFELGDIGISGNVMGGDISMGHIIKIDVRGHHHKGYSHDDHSHEHGDLSHEHGDLSHEHGDLSHVHDSFHHVHGGFSHVHGISTEKNLKTKITKINENIKAIEKLISAIEHFKDQENLQEKLKETHRIIKAIEELKTAIEHIHDQENLKKILIKIDKNIEELKAATENINVQMKTQSSRGKRSLSTAWRHILINMKMIDDLLDECKTTLLNYKQHLAKLQEKVSPLVTPWVDSVLEKFTATMTELRMGPIELPNHHFSVEFKGGSAGLHVDKFSIHSSLSPTNVNYEFEVSDDVTKLHIMTNLTTDTGSVKYYGYSAKSESEIVPLDATATILEIYTIARISIKDGAILELTNLEIARRDVSVRVKDQEHLWDFGLIEIVADIKSKVIKLVKGPLKEAIQTVFDQLSHDWKLPSLNP